MLMKIDFDVNENTEAGRYLTACARIRDITVRSLTRRLVDAIADDQLVSAVLDDGDTIQKRKQGEHKFKGPGAEACIWEASDAGS
jgi:hypothetical protein